VAELTPCYLMQLEARFLQYLENKPDGCRVWTGAKSRGGQRPWSGPYGSFWVDSEHNTVRAHVFAAFLAGKIPTLRVPLGQNLDHGCDHGTLCIDCTELVPKGVNLARGPAKGRSQKMTPDQNRGLSSVAA
jgi:hypothetical protein